MKILITFSNEYIKKAIIGTLPILFLFFFLIFPILEIIYLAFTESNTLSFSNFSSVLIDPLNKFFIYWNIQQALISVFLCILFGLPISFILAYVDIPGKSLLRNILTVPFILPPIVVLISFITVYGINGWINQIWRFLTGSNLININSYEGILLAHIFYNIPIVIRLTEIGFI